MHSHVLSHVLSQSAWGAHLILVTERGGGERAIIAPESPVTVKAVVKDADNRGMSL